MPVNRTKPVLSSGWLTLFLIIAGLVPSLIQGADYAIVVSKQTYANQGWKKVVSALQEKYEDHCLIQVEKTAEALESLQKHFPRYTCFVAQPEEAGREFVTEVHRLTRKLDDDPYTDTFWGVLTGYSAENALEIARHSQPLVVRKVASGTEFATEMVTEGQWYDELVKNKHVIKSAEADAKELKGPDDTTAPLVGLLNDYKADLMITSGHATERDWQIGYRYRNGYFRCKEGQLFGHDTGIDSNNPKVYLPIGNCLMGHIKDRESMALAWMNSAGVHQMAGYTVNTWYGYAGWGCLDYFMEQPGRYSFTEAFFANQHALIHRLETYLPTKLARAEIPPGKQVRFKGLQLSPKAREAGLRTMDAAGLLYDRDVVAFYGDPAWNAKMEKKPTFYEQSLEVHQDLYTFTIQPNRGKDSFKPVNQNGAQRGWRPIVHFLPHRIKDITIVQTSGLDPVVTDNFVLVPNPRVCDPTKDYKVVFKASRIAAQ
jgi:hypothetical protein